MELWIRSQDKDILLKTNSLLVDDNNNDIYTQDFIGENLTTYTLGRYKSKERALEVLDDISSKIKNQFIVKINGVWRPDDVKRMKDQLMEYYAGDYIMETKPLDINPINQNLIYYEMPKE